MRASYFHILVSILFLLHLDMRLQRGGGDVFAGAAADISGDHEPIQ